MLHPAPVAGLLGSPSLSLDAPHHISPEACSERRWTDKGLTPNHPLFTGDTMPFTRVPHKAAQLTWLVQLQEVCREDCVPKLALVPGVLAHA